MSTITRTLGFFIVFLCAGAPEFAFASQPNLNARLHKTAFEEKIERAPAPLAMLESLARVAPFRPEKANSDPCLQIDSESASLLGAIEPSQLKALQKEPGAMFYFYYEKCTKRIVELGTTEEESAAKNAEIIFGDPLLRKLRKTVGQNTYVDFWKLPFHTLPEDLKVEMMNRIFLFLIGPDELLIHYRYIGERTVFQRPLPTKQDLAIFLVANIAKAPSISIATLYSRLAAHLRLGPALKA